MKPGFESGLVVIMEMAPYTVSYNIMHGSMYELLLAVFSSIGGIYMIMFTLNSVLTCFACEDKYARIPTNDIATSESELINQKNNTIEDDTIENKIRSTDIM